MSDIMSEERVSIGNTLESSAHNYSSIAYRPDIDGLRAVAVVSVLLAHLKVPFFGGGFVGVDVFFVISGYLITALIHQNLQAGNFTFSEFYSRRIRRLFPAMIFTLILSSIAAYFILSPADFAKFGQTGIYTIISVNNFHSWLNSGYWDTASELKPLLHMWSLAVEEQYYLIWPAAMCGLYAIGRGPKWILGTLLAICIVSTFAAEFALSAYPSAVYYLLPFRAVELAIGALIAFLPPALKLSPAWRNSGTALGLLLILIAVFFFDENTRFPGVTALVPTFGAAFIIYCGEKRNFVSRCLSLPPVVYVGLTSYSLYLVHWPIISFYRYLRLAPGAEVYDLSSVEQGCLAIASFVLAVVSYHFVESPARLKSFMSTSRLNTLAACLAILAITGFCHVWALDGMPSRKWRADPVSAASPLADGFPPDMAAVIESVKPRQAGADINQAVRGMVNAKSRIVVVGDSHSARLHAPLADWGLKNGYAVELFKLGGGCPALLDTYVFNAKETEQQDNCNKKGADRLRDLADRGFDTILFVSRWGLYTSNLTTLDSRVRGASSRRGRSLSQDPNRGFVDDLASSEEAFVNGVTATVKYFKSKGMRVIFVTQPPPVGSGVIRCVTGQPNPAAVSTKCFPITYEDQLTEIQWSTAKLIELGKSQGFEVVNAHNVFCEDRRCKVMSSEGVYYTDGDHLSYTGATVLATEVQKYILEAK